MISDSIDQLELLWDLLPHPTIFPGVVRLFWRKKSGERGGDYARNLQELRHFVSATQGRNVYVAPNPTQSTIGMRHETKDVTHWSFLLIDVDPLSDAVNPQPALVLDEALATLGEWIGKDLKANPPIIIDSGRGMQAWIRLEDILFDDYDTIVPKDGIYLHPGTWKPISMRRKTARRSMGHWLKRLADRIGTMHECKVDSSCSDLPRLMRCPATVNQKTGRETAIICPGSGLHLGYSSLLVTGTPETVYAEPDVNAIPGRTWQMVFSDLTCTAQNYLQNGQEEPTRHKVLFHTTKKLMEVGCTKAETFKAVSRANGLCGEDQELPIEEVIRIVDQVFSGETSTERSNA
jgi:hypothetical protein